MKTTTLTVGSVTYAMKVKKLLERKDIKAKLVKIDAESSINGCSYGVSINSNNFFDTIALLKQNGIEYTVYSEK